MSLQEKRRKDMTPEQRLAIEGITADLILELHKKYGVSVLNSMRTVYSSDTFRLLSNPMTGFYHYAYLYVFETLEKELLYGKPSAIP